MGKRGGDTGAGVAVSSRIQQLVEQVSKAHQTQNPKPKATKPAAKQDSKQAQPAAKRDSNQAQPARKQDSKQAQPAPKQDSNQAQPALKQDSNQAQAALKQDSNQAQASPKQDSNQATIIATPVRSKIAPPNPASATEGGTPVKDVNEATTPAKTLNFDAPPTPMSVQSTGTPLKSPDYKRLRADDLASDSTKHCGSAAIRRPDTQSTISDLNEQFASMTLRTGALQDLMNSVTWKTPKTEASTPSLRRLDGGHAGIPYEGAPQEKKRERERERR